MRVEGIALPPFQAVLEAFERNFSDGREVGAACCVYVDGRRVVDLWGGVADQNTGRAWQADTPVVISSATKGLTSICIHLLVQRGLLDVDAPVARYWPEFAAAGKGSIPVRWVLSHRAGIPAVDQDFTMADVLSWDPVIAAVAAQKPDWEPGSQHGYHARTFGWVAGELIRRITGQSPGQFFASEVGDPLRLDCWIGLPEEIEPRVAPIVPPPPQSQRMRAAMQPYMAADTLLGRVMNKPNGLFTYDERWNTRPYHAAELPSSNGISSARALARAYAATVGAVDGIRLLDAATIEQARAEQSNGIDAVLFVPTCFGLGFSLPPALSAHAPQGSFGHTGGGGSLGFADAANRVAFGYVCNRWIMLDNSRASALVQAVYRSLRAAQAAPHMKTFA